jgi:hypothetical protein
MDSRAKAALGGKGVGRLLWLLAFERARITSTYEENGKRWRREFEFEPSVEGIVNAEPIVPISVPEIVPASWQNLIQNTGGRTVEPASGKRRFFKPLHVSAST